MDVIVQLLLISFLTSFSGRKRGSEYLLIFAGSSGACVCIRVRGCLLPAPGPAKISSGGDSAHCQRDRKQSGTGAGA
jgi:hypothetical protein